MLKINLLQENEFNELCKYVCCQLKASGSQPTDTEALYFAVYWQICAASEQKDYFDLKFDFSVKGFRRRIRDLIDEPSDVLRILDENISARINRLYWTATAR